MYIYIGNVESKTIWKCTITFLSSFKIALLQFSVGELRHWRGEDRFRGEKLILKKWLWSKYKIITVKEIIWKEAIIFNLFWKESQNIERMEINALEKSNKMLRPTQFHELNLLSTSASTVVKHFKQLSSFMRNSM